MPVYALYRIIIKGRCMKLFSNYKGDIIGGITTSVVALPMSIAFGVLAFAPMGEEFIAQGALTGIYGVIVAGIITSLFGGTPGMVSAPTAPMSVMVTAIIVPLLKDPEIAASGEDPFGIILMLVSMTIFMAGVFQLVMGAMGGGKLIKFIPFPVIAGFMNGIAIIILLEQVRPFLGVSHEIPFFNILGGESGIRYETILVGVITVLTTFLAKKTIKVVPSPLVGLVCGIAVYFFIGRLFNPSLLQVNGNPLIVGPIPTAFPTPKQVVRFFEMNTIVSIQKARHLILPAITLSILASVETLLTSVVADTIMKSKHNSTKELFGQGLGNMVSAAFGGLPVSGSPPLTLVNVHSGARTRLAGLVSCLAVLFMVLLLGGFVQWVPVAALAGILVVTAFSMIESESIVLSLKKSALGNLIVIIAVTAIAVVMDLTVAVVAGLIITAFLFIKEQIGKTIIRKRYTGDVVRSKRLRNKEADRILDNKGDLIKVYELSGSIFFGTCDKLFSEIESKLDSYIIILDLKRVHTIDLTGAQLLKQIVERVHEKSHHLLISNLVIPGDRDKDRIRRLMEDVGVIEAIGLPYIFPDTDHAQEWAEEALIRRELGSANQKKERLNVEQLTVFRDLTERDLEIVQQYLRYAAFKKSDTIFREGDPGDKFYFILYGEVSILASISSGGRKKRLTTLGAGLFFGDMAVLENKPRSATVQAVTDLEVVCMTVDDFQQLIDREPDIGSKILLGIARELSYRLRYTSMEVRVLAE